MNWGPIRNSFFPFSDRGLGLKFLNDDKDSLHQVMSPKYLSQYKQQKVHVPNFGGCQVGGDNSIQFINIGRVGDKNFKELRRKIGGWKGGWQQYFDFYMLLAR